MGWASRAFSEKATGSGQVSPTTKNYRKRLGNRASGFKAVENLKWNSETKRAEFNGTYRLERKSKFIGIDTYHGTHHTIKILDE